MDDKVILLNSNEVVDANPKLLNPDNVQYGELGVNYHKGTETISTKNDENGIAEFVPYSVYDEAIDNIQNEVFYETDEPIGKTGDVWIYKIPPIPMMIEYNVLADNLSVQLPISGNVNCDIEWGDGSKESVNSNYPTHSYIRAGVYVVKIVGDFNRLYRGSTNISKILNWGNSNMSLVMAEQAFSGYVNLTEVAGDEFGVLSRVPSFLRTFFNCSGLTTVSEDLFKYCNATTNFSGTFLNCTSLSAITNNLFINCYNAINFSQVFQGCTSLTSIPETLFNNNKEITNFTTMFQGCTSLTGNTPTTDGLQLWERTGQPGYPSSIYGTQCFYRATRLTNYSSIPTGWK